MKTSRFSYASLQTLTTATRLHNTAQGCRAATTLGMKCRGSGRNPERVARNQYIAVTQRSRRATTLSFVAQPLRGWWLLLMILALSTSAFAQNMASVRGRVADERGAGIAGAEVWLRSRAGAHLLLVTDDKGDYSFKYVVPGDYVMEVKAKGFATFTSKELRLARGQSISSDVLLSVQAVSQSVVVTATGTAQRADETSKAVSLLDSQSIEARRELTLTESLRGTPGLRVQQQGSPGALTTLRLRGLRNFDTAILFDGLRVRDSSDINGSAVSFITDLLPADLDRVEVLRGSGSSIYGTNAIGGGINLVPETGVGKRHFEFGFYGGRLSLFRERIKGAGGIGKRSGFSFGLTRIDVRKGVDGNDEYGNTVAAGRWQFNVRPSIMISANFYGTISNARLNDSPFALPAAFTSGPYPLAVDGNTFHADLNNPDEGRRTRVLVGSVRLSQQVNDKVSYSIAYQHVV